MNFQNGSARATLLTCNMLARQQVMASFVINHPSKNAVVKTQFDIVTLISARSLLVILNVLLISGFLCIPDFWGTIALFRRVKVQQKLRKFATK